MAAKLARAAAVLGAAIFIAAIPVSAADPDPIADLRKELEQLREHNRALQRQVADQQKTLDELGKRISAAPASAAIPEPSFTERFFDRVSRSRLNFSGEGAVGFMDTSANGAYPNSEFRVNEARLFLDAELHDNVYLFTELNLTTRDTDKDRPELGELYVDFENVSRLFNRDRWLNVRIGRFDIPFGEEYLTRDVIDNPLISRSLSDIWGVDEGVELYGSFGKVSYVAAVQNGGHPLLRDYDSDKAVIARISYDPTQWLHASASAMRTGDLTVGRDMLSEVWFGGGFLRGIDPGATIFGGEIYQIDLQARVPRGHLKVWGGALRAHENAPVMADERTAFYYTAEGLQNLTKKFYTAARFSQIVADDGLPLVGLGAFGPFMFNNSTLTDELWRLSIGLGYRFRQNLVLKTEFSHEEGQMLGGRGRKTDLFGAEVAFGF
ncbi:MAG TPA: hypothetical protein VEH27_10245 [Methylomirabilota bacterium]|nr:hypothetical protein [Methylomirabilota bacterium]